MHRARIAFAATFALATLLAGSIPAGQVTQAPPLPSVLAGKTFTPPIKGPADVEFTFPVTRREKDKILTRTAVKNISPAPIARLTIEEIWYGADQAVVTRSRSVINGLLQPGEIQTVTIETPYDAKLKSNNWAFSHANGVVKTHRVAKLEAPKPTPAPATTTAKPATTTAPAATTKKP